jgi:hypothetical protein
MSRTKVKGTRFKAASNPEHEPDFYSMSPVIPPVYHSDCNASNGSLVPVAPDTFYEPHCQGQDPFPLQYASLVQQQQELIQQSHYQSSATLVPASAGDSVDADCVLDEAVDELFFNDEHEERDTLDDFCSDWDPSFDSTFELSLNSDLHLGFMLEKLLED